MSAAAAAPGPVHAFITAPGLEDVLARELGLERGAGPRWPGVVSTRASYAQAVDPAFARQQMPQACAIRGTTVRELAEGVLAAIDSAIEASPVSTLHVFTPDPEAYRTVAGRAALLEAAVVSLLRERRRRAYRRFVPVGVQHGEALLVQVAVVGRTSVLVSAVKPRPLPGGGVDLAPWTAGLAPVPEDRRAPSRAYRKLQEGFAWLGAAPTTGQTCVDLGGAPGGWAWIALERGAQVTAVDRSPLQAPALGHRGLTMKIGNAFVYAPLAPVDWLLCDVICEPERTVELCATWMAAGWCRNIVATIKFKGRDGYDILHDARKRLGAQGWRLVRLKHLFHHHNEVAILASAG